MQDLLQEHRKRAAIIATLCHCHGRRLGMLCGIVVFVRIVVIVAGLSGGGEATAVALARDGKPAGVIILAENPTPAAQLAAKELQYHIKEITGAVLPIKAPSEDVTGAIILVGESEATRKLGLKSEDFKPQEDLVRIQNNTIILMGRDWQDTEANRSEVGNDMMHSLADTRKKINYSAAV